MTWRGLMRSVASMLVIVAALFGLAITITLAIGPDAVPSWSLLLSCGAAAAGLFASWRGVRFADMIVGVVVVIAALVGLVLSSSSGATLVGTRVQMTAIAYLIALAAASASLGFWIVAVLKRRRTTRTMSTGTP